MLNGLTPEQQRLIDFDKQHALKSTYYLGRRILGYQFDEQPHRELCDFVDDETKKFRLLLAPRGCFKTSVISQAYVVRRILENPNIRILLDSTALSNSQDNLMVVERHLEANHRLKELFGDFSGKKLKWNEKEFTVATRSNDKLKEPTVRASALGKVQIGPHYDLIISDDIHDKDNVRSAEQVAKVKEHLRLVFGLLDPGGEFIIGGHRWNYTDAFSMIMGDTDKPEEVEFSKMFVGNMMIKSAVYPDGKLYFPRVHTREHLERQRASLGIEFYSAMLMNEPIMVGEGQKFSQRYFRRYQQLPERLNWYLTVDPGGSKAGNDKWVIFEGAMDEKGQRYFTRYLKKTSRATQAAEDIYKWWLQRRHSRIGFEIAGQQNLTLGAIKEYLWEKYHAALPFMELTHSNDSKEARIEALSPEYEMGKIFHSEQMSEAFGLEDQLTKFPKGADDVADAAAMQKEVARAPKKMLQERKPVTLDELIADNIHKRMTGKSEVKRIHPILGSDF